MVKITKRDSIKGKGMLFLTALIWGTAFVAQDAGSDYVGAFTFNTFRMFLAAAALFIVILFKEKVHLGKNQLHFSNNEVVGGIFCGICLFAASTLQQIGISMYTENEAAAGKSGFISALYMVIVPLFGLFLHKKPSLSVCISVVLATVGMYFLCIKSNFAIQTADVFVFLCAIAFAFHILVIDYYSPKTDPVKVSFVQFIVSGLFSLVCMAAFDGFGMAGIKNAMFPIFYAGVFSGAGAYTLQISGQKYAKPSVASIILSLESVFAAITGAFFGERLTLREIIGGALVFIAVLLTQIDFKSIKTEKRCTKSGHEKEKQVAR